MKVALSGMILGASMLGANADFKSLPDGVEVSFEGGAKLTYDETSDTISASGGTAVCEAAPELGTAYRDYGDKTLANADAAFKQEYEDGSTLAFLCGIQGAPLEDIDHSQEVHQEGDKVLVHFKGTATECSSSSITRSLVSSSDAGTRYYEPTLKATLVFDCKRFQDFDRGVDMEATLKLAPTNDAHNYHVVQHMVTGSTSELTPVSGTEWEAQWTPKFDLGANQPHSAYYQYPGTCGGENCFGKITFSSDGQSIDLASDLTAGGQGWLDDDVESSNLALDKFFTAAATECDGSLVWNSGNAKAGIDAYTACGLVQSDSIKQAGAYTEHGDDAGLLTQIKCPFDNSDMFSLPAQVAKCVERGKNMFISNSCEEYRDDAPYRMVELSDGFAFELYFTDPDYSEDPYDPKEMPP